MTTSNIIPVKYVFLDVVAYTKRTIEAQCHIIKALNRIVKGTINIYHISNDSVIYIPTGDGMCIALLGADLKYDMHMTIAKEIIRRVWKHNSRVKYNWQQFEVRIGINQGDDNIVTDINGRKNVAGAGINNARRIMDLADASQILVSSPVYENLYPRKEYHHAFSREFRKEVKHGLVLKMHQLVETDTDWLDVNPPSSIVSPPEPEPKLTELSAHYFAHSIKNEAFIMNKLKEDVTNRNWLKILLWFLAEDTRRLFEATAYDVYCIGAMPYGCPDTIEEQLEWFRENVDIGIVARLSQVTLDNAIPPSMQHKYFEEVSQDFGRNLVINSKGKEKLKIDWPEIWKAFGLDEVSGYY